MSSVDLDYHIVQRAAYRAGAGIKFRLTAFRRGRYHGTKRRRLTWTDVREARAWATGDGGDLTRMAQARALAHRYRVAPDTMRSVLVNESWYDPAYRPERAA